MYAKQSGIISYSIQKTVSCTLFLIMLSQKYCKKIVRKLLESSWMSLKFKVAVIKLLPILYSKSQIFGLFKAVPRWRSPFHITLKFLRDSLTLNYTSVFKKNSITMSLNCSQSKIRARILDRKDPIDPKPGIEMGWGIAE